MATLNKVLLIGRVTADPDAIRQVASGGSVINFRFAVGRSKKNAHTGEWENDPNPLFIDCEAWSRAGDKRNLPALVAEHCRKGDQLYLEGRLQLDQWDDKTTGTKRSKHKLIVDNLEFLGGGKSGESAESNGQARPQLAIVGGGDDGETIPF